MCQIASLMGVSALMVSLLRGKDPGVLGGSTQLPEPGEGGCPDALGFMPRQGGLSPTTFPQRP